MNHTEELGVYTIQQVSDMTGLSKQVIRKWEERYGIIQPGRLDNGYRIYSKQDVNILIKIKMLSAQGHSIKQAASLIKKQTFHSHFYAGGGDSSQTMEQWNEYVCRLIEKGNHCDEIELNLILQEAYHHLGLSHFISTVIIPFLKEVGNKWEKREWSEYQESVASLVVRDFLVHIRRNYQYRENAPFVIGACLPHERHEVPLHLVLLQFMIKGWKTQLIGASPAPGSIESLVSKLKPKVVLLSATTTAPFKTDLDYIRKLDQFAAENHHIEFFLGGNSASALLEDYHPKAITITNSIEDILTRYE